MNKPDLLKSQLLRAQADRSGSKGFNCVSRPTQGERNRPFLAVAMSGQGFLEVHRALFIEAAGGSSDDGTADLHKPGLAGVNIMMSRAAADASDALLTDEDVSMSNLTAAFDEFAWTYDKSLTWGDMEKLLEHLKSATDGEEADADEQGDIAEGFASLIDEIAERQQARGFPLVLPRHCQGHGGEEQCSRAHIGFD